MKNHKFTETLGNIKWLVKNEAAIKDMLPKTWTHMNNLNGLQMGYKMKLIGIDWRSQDEFGQVMVYLEKIGFMLRQNKYQVRANNESLVK